MSRITYRDEYGDVRPEFGYTLADAVEKLAHYEDLEEQGRLIELPCKVGDTVYVVGWDIIDWDTEDFSSQTRRWFIYENLFDVEMIYAIGKMIFLTKEEAEAKLAELKGTEE
jgi:hypothetical protein